jgi:hypothetical protein
LPPALLAELGDLPPERRPWCGVKRIKEVLDHVPHVRHTDGTFAR